MSGPLHLGIRGCKGFLSSFPAVADINRAVQVDIEVDDIAVAGNRQHELGAADVRPVLGQRDAVAAHKHIAAVAAERVGYARLPDDEGGQRLLLLLRAVLLPCDAHIDGRLAQEVLVGAEAPQGLIGIFRCMLLVLLGISGILGVELILEGDVFLVLVVDLVKRDGARLVRIDGEGHGRGALVVRGDVDAVGRAQDVLALVVGHHDVGIAVILLKRHGDEAAALRRDPAGGLRAIAICAHPHVDGRLAAVVRVEVREAEDGVAVLVGLLGVELAHQLAVAVQHMDFHIGPRERAAVRPGDGDDILALGDDGHVRVGPAQLAAAVFRRVQRCRPGGDGRLRARMKLTDDSIHGREHQMCGKVIVEQILKIGLVREFVKPRLRLLI